MPSWTSLDLGGANTPTGNESITSVNAEVINRTNTGPTVPGELPSHKLGHNFCFIGCDMRRTVIILNSILVVLDFLILFLSRPLFKVLPYLPFAVAEAEIVTIINFLLSLFALYGAVYYKPFPLLAKALYQIVYYVLLVMTLLSNDGELILYTTAGVALGVLLPVLCCAAFVYIYLSLAIQIQKGILSPDRYSRYEEYCCCGSAPV